LDEERIKQQQKGIDSLPWESQELEAAVRTALGNVEEANLAKDMSQTLRDIQEILTVERKEVEELAEEKELSGFYSVDENENTLEDTASDNYGIFHNIL
jgi:hypothetical protein